MQVVPTCTYGVTENVVATLIECDIYVYFCSTYYNYVPQWQDNITIIKFLLRICDWMWTTYFVLKKVQILVQHLCPKLWHFVSLGLTFVSYSKCGFSMDSTDRIPSIESPKLPRKLAFDCNLGNVIILDILSLAPKVKAEERGIQHRLKWQDKINKIIQHIKALALSQNAKSRRAFLQHTKKIVKLPKTDHACSDRGKLGEKGFLSFCENSIQGGRKIGECFRLSFYWC